MLNKVFYLIWRSLKMGTSKNDMMMILQLAKTFLAKKFKLKKGGDPFAKLGRAWQEPHLLLPTSYR